MSLATASVLASLNFFDTVVFEALLAFGAIVHTLLHVFVSYVIPGIKHLFEKLFFFFFKNKYAVFVQTMSVQR